MYRLEETGDIVISGFEEGIGDSPYKGLTDVRNMNLISIPGEASVNFATQNIAAGAISGSVTSVSGTTATFTGGSGLENYTAIYFTSTGSFTGFTTATPYWVQNLSGSTFSIYSDYAKTTIVNLGGTGTANFTAYQMGYAPSFVSGGGGLVGGIKRFAQPVNVLTGSYLTFGVDAAGLVWSNQHPTGTNSYWSYTGNSIVNGSNVRNASGGGLVYWRVSNGATGLSIKTVDYLFVIRNDQIDYYVVQTTGSGTPTEQVWNYGWNPSTASTGATSYLTTPPGFTGSHDAITSFDGRVYFCDGSNVQKIFQTAPTTMFDPTNGATYTYTTYNLLPINDSATCLSPFGTNILIGGQGNLAYQWNTTANLISNYIPIAESYVSKIVTVNTNAYIFAGSRGRIYTTNGAQANLWKKVPDHLSNIVEPMYEWGGATAVKNQLYFSFRVFNNAHTSLGIMGGLWAADLDTGAIRLANQLSYGTYAGVATAILPKVYSPDAADYQSGIALFVGWYDGVTTCGIDQPSNNPYTGGQAYLVSDMIPIGTFLKKQTPTQLEFKLSTPLQLGESVQLLASSSLSANTNPTFTSAGTAVGDGALLSANFPIPIQTLQWIMVKAVSTGTTGTPSFNRLTELRIISPIQG